MRCWWRTDDSVMLVVATDCTLTPAPFALSHHPQFWGKQEELAALSALDKLGLGAPAGEEGESGAESTGEGTSYPGGMLSVGMRIEYWWNESVGWCKGKLTSKTELMGEVLTVRWAAVASSQCRNNCLRRRRRRMPLRP